MFSMRASSRGRRISGGPNLVAEPGLQGGGRGEGRRSGGAGLSSIGMGKAVLAERLRRRRTALGWPLARVAARALS